MPSANMASGHRKRLREKFLKAGLSVCHGIVTEHGGRIYVKSKPRKGTSFIVELPVTAEKTEENTVIV